VSPGCPVHQAEQRLPAQRSTTQCPDRATVCGKSQSRRRRRTRQWTMSIRCGTGLSGAAPDCPVPQEVRAPTVKTVRTLTVEWRGSRTGQSGGAHRQTASPMVGLVVGGYKYPITTTTPSIQVFQTSHSIQELVQSIQDTIQENQSLSKSHIHSKQIVTKESFARVLWALVLGSLSSSSILVPKLLVIKARDTKCGGPCGV
jgi:hypothetical protein